MSCCRTNCRRLTIIATKGTLDWAYPPFILASTSAALGWDTSIFFTFYGLLLLKKEVDSLVSPLGNPAMPMKMPFGPKWFQDFDWPMPNLLMAGVPGFEKVATGLMKKTFKNKGVATIEELRDLCVEAEVNLSLKLLTMWVLPTSCRLPRILISVCLSRPTRQYEKGVLCTPFFMSE